MCALHYSVTYNVMIDNLSKTKTLLVTGAYMGKSGQEDSEMQNGSISQKFHWTKTPKNDPRDGRNFGIFLTFVK